MNDMGLTVKQQRFVECYDGNATQSALQAGYSPRTAAFIGAENLKKPQIKAAIAERESAASSVRVATRIERQAFWTRIMDDEEVDLRDRLRASELLGKSECDFVEKIALDAKVGVSCDVELEALLAADPESRRLLAANGASAALSGESLKSPQIATSASGALRSSSA